MNRRGILFSLVVQPALFLRAQPPAPPLAFDVASIRPNISESRSSGITTNKGRFRAENVTLKRLIQAAYHLPDAQILGGPDWLDTDRFDVNATADRPADGTELMQMLQALLADRFRLASHLEKRQLSGYALTVDKGGSHLKPSAPGAGSSTHTSNTTNNSVRQASIDATATSMDKLADALADQLHMPVNNQTQLEGNFDFRLNWTPEDLQAPLPDNQPADTSTGASIFSALREQLGLRLEARKVPTDVLVVDQAEQPSAN